MDKILKNRKVSILLCFYERPSFVPLILSNLKSQTFVRKFPNSVELVIADDSHERYAMDIENVKTELRGIIDDVSYHRITDRKLTIGEKRNMLCDKAKHPILIFFDDDDYYFPMYVQYSVTELLKRNKVLVGSNSMLFCYVHEQFKKSSISCVSPRQIHEATMCFMKSHWKSKGGFTLRGNGEGAGMIDGCEDKVNARLDIGKLMVCVCHKKNTCNKDLFLHSSAPAQYTWQNEINSLILDAVQHPLYTERRRICFKYPTRERPEQFKRCIEKYIALLSGKHEYQFVVSMDTNDATMDNTEIRSYLDTIRRRYQIDYYYGTSNSKIDAINRDLLAPCYDVLVLISDDMIPVVQDFDDIIVRDFLEYFPDFDGMLNYNDGLRPDWPKICTLTVYGHKYYDRFRYIYYPKYVSVYCDQEQTEVGRQLGKIRDIDHVIIQHVWSDPIFQDALRSKTEDPVCYQKDRELFEQRKSCGFSETPTTIVKTNIVLSILIPSLPSRSVSLKRLVDEIERQIAGRTDIEWCCLLDNKVHSVGSKRNALLSLAKGRYITFIDDDDFIAPQYISTIVNTITSSTTTIDVITFKQRCTLDGGKTFFIVDADMQHITDETVPLTGPWKSEYKRLAWHWCVFRSETCKSIPFPDKSLYEDQEWLKRVYSNLKIQAKVNDVLHYYQFSPETTETQRQIRSVPRSKKHVLVTACDEEFAISCITLISSVFAMADSDVDAIVVYDLGLLPKTVKLMNSIDKIQVVPVPENCFDGFMTPNQFAWKPVCLLDARRFGDLIVWLDSGIVVIKPLLYTMYDRLNSVGSWFSLDPEHRNREWTHPECQRIMNATTFEMNECQLLAGIVGYDTSNEKAVRLISEAVELCRNKQCVHGQHYHEYGPGIKGHRHDQSIMSILVARYRMPTVSKFEFMDWRNINDAQKSTTTFLFVHHRSIVSLRSIRQRPSTTLTLPSTFENETITEYITSDDIMTSTSLYRKFEYLFEPGMWRGKMTEPFPYSTHDAIVVSGHSDYAMSDDAFRTILDKFDEQNGSLRCMFAQNATCTTDDRLIGLPIGLTNKCHDSPEHLVLGDTTPFERVLTTLKTIENLVYANFSVSTNDTARRELLENIQNVQWITTSTMIKSIEGRQKYISDIYHHAFCLCPSGNGIDTHRLWECLYLKTIPIVQEHDMYKRHFSELPILRLPCLADITSYHPNLLLLEYTRILRCTAFRLDQLTSSYWKAAIRSPQKEFPHIYNTVKNVEFHTTLSSIEHLLSIQSYLATQSLIRTTLHVWTTVPVTTAWLRPYVPYIVIHNSLTLSPDKPNTIVFENNVVFLKNLEPLFTSDFFDEKREIPSSYYTTDSSQRPFVFERLRARNIGKTVILTHLGLGDHIICNGLVRFYTTHVSPYVVIVVKQRNAENVQQMYVDLIQTNSIGILSVNDDAEISPNTELYGDKGSVNMLKRLDMLKYTVIACGLHLKMTIDDDFIRTFYNDTCVPLERYKNAFVYSYNKKRSEEICASNTDKYVVVHEYDTYTINRTYLPKETRIVSLHNLKQYSVFDLKDLIEGAVEVHVIDSSILWFIELAQLSIGKRFFHQNSKPHLHYDITSHLSNDWSIVV